MAKIVDSFTFFNEKEMLLLRLKYLKNIVDHFVIVEATRTHQGETKELQAYNIVATNMPEILNKITFIFVEELSIAKGNDANWARNDYQRNCISRGIYKFNENDMIIVSDLDEIPNASTLEILKSNTQVLEKGIAAFQMTMHMYNASKVLYKRNQIDYWLKARIGLLKHIVSPRWMRKSEPKVIIGEGGWHMTYMGGLTRIKKKIESFCHAEFNTEYYKENIRNNIEKNLDPFGREGYSLRDYDRTKLPSLFYEFDEYLGLDKVSN